MNEHAIKTMDSYANYLVGANSAHPGSKRQHDKAKAIRRRKIAKRSRAINRRSA